MNNSKHGPFVRAKKFQVDLDENYTIVRGRNTIFLDRNVSLALSSHRNDGECECPDVLHVRKFYFKTFHQGRTKQGCERVDLHISCEPDPGLSIKCEVGGVFVSPDSRASEYNGWKYLNTLLFCSESKFGEFRLKLNLYTDRSCKPDIPALPTHSVFTDLSEIFMDGKYSDVTVSTEDGATIKAHRAILAKRSEVFRAALEHNEMENNNITSPFKHELLKQIITYIYTYKPPNPGEITADLFMAADYYQLPGLKTVCISTFCNQLTAENAIATIQLAEQHSLAGLRYYSLQYIKNHFDEIAKIDDWKNLDSIDLMRLISEFLGKKTE